MYLTRIQNFLKERELEYTYTEEDNLGSLDFLFRGLRFHVWEYEEDGVRGAETNVYNADRTIDVEGDYEATILEEMEAWPKGMK